jgi:6-phosphofructokinase 1
MKLAIALLSTSFLTAAAFTGTLAPLPVTHRLLPLASEPKAGELWKVEKVDHVSDWTGSTKTYPNPLSLKDNVPSSWFIGLNDAVAARVQVNALETLEETCLLSDDFDDPNGDFEMDCEVADRNGVNAEAFILAGPRAEIAFDPKECKAAIVTCGGLCPGLNSVIREVVMCLRRQYGVTETYGVPAGYRGFLEPETWRSLDEEAVKDLHNQGGSILGSSRGGHDTNAIVDSLVDQGVTHLFVVGGDGTVRGAAKIADEVKARGLPMAVAVVPKTIDNDVPLLDRTFGFESAVEAARSAINVANVEAEGFPHGLGVVKVMGRNSGFIAMHSALGSCVADLCLVPEVNFYLDGPGGIVDHLYERILDHDKAVVVIAEGAGQELMAEMGAAGEEVRDASGNVLLDDVGPWLCKQLKQRLDDRLKEASTHGDGLTLKYVDPSYMVRGIKPNTADNLYCLQLAHNAVHGAMAGLSSFLVGSVNTRECYVPIELVANKRNVIDTSHQSLWEYVVFSTGQPSFQTNDDRGDDEDVITTASGGVVLST